MRFITVTWQRANVTQQQHLAMQLDNMSVQQATYLGGQSPYDSYWLYSVDGSQPAVQRGDLLFDENEVDPKTGMNTRYRVFGNPEFDDLMSGVDIPVEKSTGKPQ